jgi:hypothetical protein
MGLYGKLYILRLSFIVAPNTTALSDRKPVSAGASVERCGAQYSYKRDALYSDIIFSENHQQHNSVRPVPVTLNSSAFTRTRGKGRRYVAP